MEIDKIKTIIEAILFSAGRVVETNEFIKILEISEEDVHTILQNMKAELEGTELSNESGIQIDDC